MTDAATEIEALRAALSAAEARADALAAEAAHAKALVSGGEALIGHLRLEIEKLRREIYGQRSERKLPRPRTRRSPRLPRRRRRQRSPLSNAASPSASRSPSICRASGS